MSYDPYQSPSPLGAYSTYPPKPGMESPQNPLAMILGVSSIVTGLMGFLTCFCCFFIPFSVISLALGIPVFFIRSADSTSKMLAIVGVICGALGLIGFLVALALGAATVALDPQFQQQFNK